ncbi:MAG: LysR family transcriptional regulator [Myxococcales bacterium]|nr:LysR family transcriptional regulator [Myxococcales bacterium]
MSLQERNAARPGKGARARVERLDWDLVRVFLDVARAGRLAGAAPRAGLDVSTVSRRLDRLEAELGVTLFERGSSGVVLTAAGEKLVPAAEDMARAMGELGVALDAVEAAAEGVVRVTVPPGVADVFVAPALVRFHARHPRVRIDLDASVGYADLTRGEADLALRVRRPERGDLIAQRLVATRSVPATAPAYAAELGRLRTLDAARWIAWGHDLAQLPEARWLTAHVATPPVLRTSSFAAQLNAAAAGLGVTLAPEPYLARSGLAPVRPGRALTAAWAALPIGELWLVGHVALRRVPRVAVLWQFLHDELTQPWT